MKGEKITFNYLVEGDNFVSAGEASSNVKFSLKKLGIPSDAVRKVAIAMYEGEINMVIHASGGSATVDVYPQKIVITLSDKGPGIPDVDLAMQEGWTTAPDNIRSLGFGAGMGLSNMKRYSDYLQIDTAVGIGTTVTMEVNI